jgi:hypothetical protein
VDGAIDVAPDAVVTATFDELLDAATVTDTSFLLTPDGGSPVAAVVTWDAGTLTATLTPGAVLDLGALYEARLTTAVTDTSGNALAADYV